MGAIVDTLFLDEKEMSILVKEYPDCKVVNQSHSDYGIQRYRVIIPNDDNSTDSYYLFLINHGIAMSSRNFLGRIASDQKFVDRMRLKVTESLNKMKVADDKPATEQEAALQRQGASDDKMLGV